MKILKCVKKGSDLKVQVVGEEGFVQFPKNLRSEGKLFAVDGLKKTATHWRVEGQIYEMTPVGDTSSTKKSASTATEEEFIEFTENNDNEGETWSFFAPVNIPGVTELMAVYDRYQKEDDGHMEAYSYKKVTKKTVVTLMNRKSKTDYMAEYNLVESLIHPKEVLNKKIKSIEQLTNLDDIEDYLYKGKCFKKK